MRDPRPRPPLAAVPQCRPETDPEPEPGPLPRCPVCDGAPERVSWRQQSGRPVSLVFEPCGHRHTSPAPPALAITPPGGPG
ncbi:hypothetical protein AB0953_26635 [Streptomyces sp. NPDC046866]|uniref:hypothetical protein n=1 Tax=Streptomyces sp. NPDC046866 TaxID=3154921 RepID=UPI0034551C6A